MLADFTITIHDVDKPMAVRVVVHDNLRALRSAVTQQDRVLTSRKKRKPNQYKNTLGICQRFHIQDYRKGKDGVEASTYAIVRLAPPYVGAGMVAHELTHAAVWLWQIKHQFKDVLLTCENDEWFAWVLGELVRRTTNKLFEKGVYR